MQTIWQLIAVCMTPTKNIPRYRAYDNYSSYTNELVAWTICTALESPLCKVCLVNTKIGSLVEIERCDGKIESLCVLENFDVMKKLEV